MNPLYLPERHAPLENQKWEAEMALAFVSEWTEAAYQAYSERDFWPVHARERSDFPGDFPLMTLYAGAAGTLLALEQVRQLTAFHDSYPSLVSAVPQIYTQYLKAPDTASVVPSWIMGGSGLLCLNYPLDPQPWIEDKLADWIVKNRENPTWEALWGSPGTLVAALFMAQWTQAPRWTLLYLDSVDALIAQWRWDTSAQTWLWTQDMYEKTAQYLGAGHGWAGNIYPLLRGLDLLPARQRSLVLERTVHGLKALVQVQDNQANWPPFPGFWKKPMVQWCHGAPGIISALHGFPVGMSPELETLLAQGGELIWQAGPLAKGAGLCHGTDGNGFAFLKLYQRSQNPLWLERARAFAMHAMQQAQTSKAETGSYRFGLWSGDAGLVCFILACLQETAELPGLDRLLPGDSESSA